MTELSTSSRPKRPEFRNINAFKDLPSYRWPLASLVSGMHRISGLIMILLMPFIIWMFDTSISSEISFARFTSAFNAGLGFVPGWFMKLLVLGLIWSYLHHFFAGLRNVWMETTHSASKESGSKSALLTLTLTFGLTAVLGAKLFGLY
ncbi:succinate dehydrogenase, cytochrome b556 subunit [Rhodoferax sp.]|uniref:succinate dehydrogenase, cytochrome b556 subunit n=1 Tax=Rhodoferax sp. TaxID=50421 RepID=UPI002768BF5D|nr:succinate dehydrogenase, cytochrome b556 subunit [Rhodoferax sp.]